MDGDTKNSTYSIKLKVNSINILSIIYVLSEKNEVIYMLFSRFHLILYHSFILLQDVCPDRYIECFIAEQNLVGVAVGAACRNRTIPFASTFACFLSRAYDQLRMAAVSQTDANFCGSHVGVSIGQFLNFKLHFIKCGINWCYHCFRS